MDWLGISIIAARVLIEVVFFAIGISVFSFLNVVIYRLPRHMQFTGGRSMCTSCKHELASKDLVPVISWISLKGKCRYCGAPISARYTIVELLGGVFAVLFTLLCGIRPMAAVYFILSGVITVVVFIYIDRVKGK
jgi:leader peptidase (prepilin peptidase)/N-methyltransferase